MSAAPDTGSVPSSEPLLFYSTKDAYGCFSNFSRHPVHLPLYGSPAGSEVTPWPTTEHYFQAMKFVPHADHIEAVRRAAGGMEAAKCGRERSRPLRPDWDAVKDDVMYVAVTAKFTQQADLRAVLLETGTRTIVEHTANDRYWADGGDGTGKNMLGQLLMRVRADILAELRSNQERDAEVTDSDAQ
jgi:ribA/ribD-fused uncharacterized protein